MLVDARTRTERGRRQGATVRKLRRAHAHGTPRAGRALRIAGARRPAGAQSRETDITAIAVGASVATTAAPSGEA